MRAITQITPPTTMNSPNSNPKADPLAPVPLVDMRADFSAHGEETIAAMTKVAQSGAFIMGPEVSAFEDDLSAFLSRSNGSGARGSLPKPRATTAIGVSDGTAALQLCLLALDIGPGDEVVTTPFTWISSAEVIPLVGASPVFVDIEPSTCLLDTRALEAVVTPRTRAVIAVSLFGVAIDARALRTTLDAAEQRFGTKIALIEDGAQSFGASRGGYMSCASPHVTLSTTSFFPTKPLGGYGDGGAVFSADTALADRVRALRVHGKVKGKHAMVGLNSRLDSVQAAVLRVKLRALDDALGARRRAAEVYNRLLSTDPRVIRPPSERELQASHGDDSLRLAWAIYSVRVRSRDAVRELMTKAGIASAVYYPVPCHLQPMFGAQDEAGNEANNSEPLRRCENAEGVAKTVLALPMHAYLTEDVQNRVVAALRSALDDLGVDSHPA